jgi:hypothetical protein
MTPEQFYHLNKLKEMDTIFEMRVKSLEWMLGCYLKGTIRRRTIINLIPIEELDKLIVHMEEKERYEDCATIRDVINIVYKQKYLSKENMSTKRKKEIIRLLENTIRKEQEKKGGGNKELIEKLEIKLQEVKDRKIKK